MSPAPLLLTTAYFPPVHYFALINSYEEFFIEIRENYIKQTFRNRCRIYSANGPLDLSVPVLEGSYRKRPINELRIDYSKRWQQVHLGAIESAYGSSPYFEFYFDGVKEIVLQAFELLTELNIATTKWSLDIIGMERDIGYTEEFLKPAGQPGDYRYLVTPKNKKCLSLFTFSRYSQAFSERYGFLPGLSILDLVFNMGSHSGNVIEGTKISV